MTQDEKFKYMTTTPVPQLISKLAVPTMISMMITALYNAADTFFVGKIDVQASAAVGIVFNLMAIIQAFGFTFGHGSGILVSLSLGKKEDEKAKTIANSGFVYAIVFGALLAVCCFMLRIPLAYILGSTDTILPYSLDYMNIILIGMPWMMGSIVLNNQIRYQGNAMTSMLGIMSGAVLNVALDPLLIFVFKLGIRGAAIATVTGQLVSFIILWITTYKGDNIPISLRPKYLTARYFPTVFAKGFPSLLRQGLAATAGILLNAQVKEVVLDPVMQDNALCAMGLVSRVSMIANSLLIGFGQGFQPVCSYNFGAKLYKRVLQGFKFCVLIALYFLLTVSIVIFIFAPFIITFMMPSSKEVTYLGSLALRAQCLTYPFGSVIIITNMLLQASGQSKEASLVASGRQGLFLLPVLLILPRIFGLYGVLFAQPVADAGSFVLAGIFAILFVKKVNKWEKLKGESV